MESTIFTDNDGRIIKVFLDKGPNHFIIKSIDYTGSELPVFSLNPKTVYQKELKRIMLRQSNEKIDNVLLDYIEKLIEVTNESSENLNFDELKNDPKLIVLSKYFNVLVNKTNGYILKVMSEDECEEYCSNYLKKGIFQLNPVDLNQHLVFNEDSEILKKNGISSKADFIPRIRDMKYSSSFQEVNAIIHEMIPDFDQFKHDFIKEYGYSYFIGNQNKTPKIQEHEGQNYYIFM